MGIFRFIGGAVTGIALAPFTGGASLIATGLATGLITEAIGDDNDKQKISNARREGYNTGFDSGYDKGAIDTAKKFAAKVERDNNFRIAAFALGNHISRLAGNPYDKVAVIVGTLGNPNSKMLSDYIRSENKKIIDEKPTFYQIKEKYLKHLSGEDLQLIDEFLEDVVNEGDYNSACSNFYNNEWKNYLNSDYEKPMSEHNFYSPFELAENYYYGLNGWRQDKDLAKKYYIKAARSGNYDAKTKLIDFFNYYC